MTTSETVTETIATASTTAASTTATSATATATATATADAADTIVKISIKTPIIYVSVLIITLVIFSIYHRRSKINGLRNLTNESLFSASYDADTASVNVPTPDSTPAVMFTDLQELEAHEKMLKVALVSRAAEALRRIVKLKETEQSVMMLYTRGLIGDDTFKRYQLQVKLQDAEMQDIAMNAEQMKQGWSKAIFASAQEVMMNQALRRRVGCIAERMELSDRLMIDGVEDIVKGIQTDVQRLKQPELVKA